MTQREGAMTKLSERAWTEFEVSVRDQFPAWDGKEPTIILLQARSKAEAIKFARRRCEPGLGTGRLIFSAKEVQSNVPQ